MNVLSTLRLYPYRAVQEISPVFGMKSRKRSKSITVCTDNRGKRDLPRFREDNVAVCLGEPLKGLQVPPAIVKQMATTLDRDQETCNGNDQL